MPSRFEGRYAPTCACENRRRKLPVRGRRYEFAVEWVVFGSRSCDVAGAQRSVEANVLTSTAEPRIRMLVDKALRYAGVVRLVLSSADAEVHVFVAGASGR